MTNNAQATQVPSTGQLNQSLATWHHIMVTFTIIEDAKALEQVNGISTDRYLMVNIDMVSQKACFCVYAPMILETQIEINNRTKMNEGQIGGQIFFSG